jgi:hypothetical protein
VNTDVRSVRRRRIVFVVLSDLVEVILVQLTDETCKVAVLEVLGQNGLGELLVLRRCQYVIGRYTCSRLIPQEPQNSRLPRPILLLIHRRGPPASYSAMRQSLVASMSVPLRLHETLDAHLYNLRTYFRVRCDALKFGNVAETHEVARIVG